MRSRLLGLLAGTAALSLASIAQAADLPARPAPFVAPIPIFTWTGFYAGLQVGYGWSDNGGGFNGVTALDLDGDGFNDVVAVDNGFFNDDDDADGFIGGVHVGYNVQFGSLVLGAEADLDLTDLGGGRSHAFEDVVTGERFLVHTGHDIDWQGSLRARLGFAFDRTLLYATGGFAFADFGGNGDPFAGRFGTFFNDDGGDTEWGWTLGAGVEYAFTNNLTARLEYRYTAFDIGGDVFNNVAFDNGGDVDFHTLRAGVSFKF